MLGYAKRRCILSSIIVVLAVVSTVYIYNYHTPDWLNQTNSHLIQSLVAKVESAKTLKILEELIELTSPKDPKCQPNNSTSAPYPTFSSAFTIQLACLLLSYRQQHIRWRKLLLEGKVEKIRTLTWYCNSGCGGLGDRIRSIGFSLMLAMISDRLLLVQWRQPFEVGRQNNIFEPAAIDWNVDQVLVDKLSKLSTASVTILMPGSSKSQRANLIEKFITNSEHRHVRIKTNIVFNGFVELHQLLTAKTLENKRYQVLINETRGETPVLPDSIHGVFVRYLFKFSPPVLEKADQIMKEMNMSDIEEYGVANIRSGFLGTLNEEAPYNYTIHSQQWEVILDQAVNKSEQLGIHVPVVLCCDSEKVKSWAQAHYTGKVISIPGKPVHVDYIRVADKLNAEIQTAAEGVIMSRATFLCRSFINGFTNVAIHMCPFVKSSASQDRNIKT